MELGLGAESKVWSGSRGGAEALITQIERLTGIGGQVYREAALARNGRRRRWALVRNGPGAEPDVGRRVGGFAAGRIAGRWGYLPLDRLASGWTPRRQASEQ
jgi:hypothetical protein